MIVVKKTAAYFTWHVTLKTTFSSQNAELRTKKYSLLGKYTTQYL
jgi:hypothetical protein